MQLARFFTKKSALLLLLLLITALVLSIASYEYSTQVSANVANLSVDEIHSNTQIEANDLGHVLEKSLGSISSNLDVIANSRIVSTQNITGAAPLFNAAENSTKDLTFTYFWLDKNGLLLLSSHGTSQIFAPGTGVNLNNRSYFISPRDNKVTFFSAATPLLSNASVEFLFVSRPVFASIQNQSNAFNGVVGASIDLRTLGRSLQSDLSPKFQSAIGILDFKGGILYSANESIIGQNIFGSAVQNTIPPDLKPEFNAFLNQSLKGQVGLQDISYRGSSGTLAYQPIFVNATTANGGHVPVQFGVLYVTASDTLAASAAALIGQERSASLLIVLGIAGVSGGLALTTLRWNKRLDDAVKQKTADLVSANSQLAAKAKAEKDLLNITAHELRTPTQSILVNSEILRRVIRPVLGIEQPPLTTESFDGSRPEYDMLAGDIEPKEIVEMVESSYRNSQRLQKLTQNILEVARIDNNTLRLEREIFDLNDVVKQPISDARRFLYKDGDEPPANEIRFEPKQPELILKADRTKLGEVITNLLENSIKFTNERGTISVTTDKDDKGFAIVTVKDEGSGIDPEIFPQLFSKFATKTGTGLGLYISKAYVEAHGGKISAENNCGESKGAIFSFTIPLTTDAVSKDEQIVNVVQSVEEKNHP
jgi:signal transduction histidine kinase